MTKSMAVPKSKGKEVKVGGLYTNDCAVLLCTKIYTDATRNYFTAVVVHEFDTQFKKLGIGATVEVFDSDNSNEFWRMSSFKEFHGKVVLEG